HRRFIIISALTYTFALSACGGGGSSTQFMASLNGASEVPPVNTSATGTATFTVAGSSVNYSIMATGLSGNAVASHIHVGAPTVSGPIVLPFPASAISKGGKGSVTIPGTFTPSDGAVQTNPPINNLDDLLAQMKAGNTYANIHTAAHGAGEIRGQI